MLDTRPGKSTIDGAFAGTGRIGAQEILNLQVLGRGGVLPSGVSAVALNVTVISPTSTGFLTLFPKGEDRPLAANLNFNPGDVIPNMVIAKVGADGSVSIYNGSGGTVDIVVDVAGWYGGSP